MVSNTANDWPIDGALIVPLLCNYSQVNYPEELVPIPGQLAQEWLQCGGGYSTFSKAEELDPHYQM